MMAKAVIDCSNMELPSNKCKQEERTIGIWLEYPNNGTKAYFTNLKSTGGWRRNPLTNPSLITTGYYDGCSVGRAIRTLIIVCVGLGVLVLGGILACYCHVKKQRRQRQQGQ